MSGARYARQTRAVMAKALTVACVVLLCVFGAGPAATTVADSRPASSTAPAEPTESPSDPAADPEVRAAVRTVARVLPGARQLPRAVFHVKHPNGPTRVASFGTAEPALSGRTVRSVVLRC
ncbi:MULTISPECIES: hypothetical protein [unclassified Streptomyces]|uniref:hypothetical protein n=1 Tax=unclassified Streptomyces TaxID=2593676 RepID=UPI00225BF8DE|nr:MULTISPECIES: hypothetical protein [unclassified Streptomyces]MCX4526957.1 hypothetical protein [Streptomyces sp. NBC_01551]MCX4542483.1 hypothetical protein [Streptomyces sp. NBC_01565]